jgi:hypothetical protein
MSNIRTQNLILVQQAQDINSIKSRLLKVEQQLSRLADVPAGGRKKRRRMTRRKRGRGLLISKKTNKPKRKYFDMAYNQLKDDSSWVHLSFPDKSVALTQRALELQSQKAGRKKTRRKRRRKRRTKKRRK